MLIFYPKKDVYHKTALPLNKKSLEAIKEKKIQRTHIQTKIYRQKYWTPKQSK